MQQACFWRWMRRTKREIKKHVAALGITVEGDQLYVGTGKAKLEVEFSGILFPQGDDEAVRMGDLAAGADREDAIVKLHNLLPGYFRIDQEYSQSRLFWSKESKLAARTGKALKFKKMGPR